MAEDSPQEQEETRADEAVAEEAADEEAPAPETPPRGGALPVAGLLLAGALAAMLGFAAARTVFPEGWPFPGVEPEPDPLAVALEAQKDALAELAARLDALAQRVDALEADTGLADLRAALRGGLRESREGIEAAEARIADLREALDAMDARLRAVEKLPHGAGSEAAEAAARAYERELAAMREMLDGELARIRATQEAAAAGSRSAGQAAHAAALRAARARLAAALESGQPFAEALAELAELSGRTPPEALAAAAETGIPTLNDLQSAFPDAARAALSASVAALVEAGRIGRFEGFLRSQLGTRSLAPKEGDDPDAVLSRAEAALKAGDLSAALAEIAALPEAGQREMAPWLAEAERRRQALAAAEAMSAGLDTQ